MSYSRRAFLQGGAAAAILGFLPHGRLAALPWFREGEFKALRRNVGLFTMRGGTMGWLVNDDAIVVVDSQFPASAGAFWKGLEGRQGRKIDYLINSHHHGDHTAGNFELRNHAKKILAHQNVPGLMKARAKARNNEATQAYPDTLYETAWSTQVGDEVVSAHWYGNAHTAGDSVIHFENADVVHMGDLIFNRMAPFIDIDGGASSIGWISVLEKVHARFSDATTFIFGHGHSKFGITGTRTDVLVLRDYLAAANEHVAKGLKAGKSEDEITAVEKLSGFPDHFSERRRNGVGRSLKAIYREQAKSAGS